MALAFIFGDVGIGEWFVLLAVVLIVVGPKRLPETARKIGRMSARLHRMAEEFRRQLMAVDAEADRAAARADAEFEAAFRSEGDEAKAVPSEKDAET